MALDAMIVPEQEPRAEPSWSRKSRSRTGEVAVEHSVPLTMAVPTALQALLVGTDGVGVGDGELGEEPPPPHPVHTSVTVPTTTSVLRNPDPETRGIAMFTSSVPACGPALAECRTFRHRR